MSGPYRSTGSAELRPVGAVAASGAAVANCPACQEPQAFQVLLPARDITREGRAGLLLRTYRRCSSCHAQGAWLLRPLLEPEAEGMVIHNVNDGAHHGGDSQLHQQQAASPGILPPRRYGRNWPLLAPPLTRGRQPLPIPEGPRLTLAGWTKAAHQQPISRRGVLAAVTAANPGTVARHYRAAYGRDPQRASTCGTTRAYAWEELVQIFDGLEAEAAS